VRYRMPYSPRQGEQSSAVSLFVIAAALKSLSNTMPIKIKHSKRRGRLGRLKESMKRKLSEHLSSALTNISSTHYNTDFMLAVEAAEEQRALFRNSLPASLTQRSQSSLWNAYDNSVATFNIDEIELGPNIGSGQFGSVYEVQSFCLQSDVTLSDNEVKKRQQMKRCEKYRQTKRARYALKHIKTDYHSENGSDLYIQAASDLALEAEFLANLNHPHIIKLRGLAMSGVTGFANGPHGYFLIIDRLSETLDMRIKRWHGRKRKELTRRQSMSDILNRSITAMPETIKRRSSCDDEKNEVEPCRNEVLDECLSVALQISAAMVYLHSHSIMFRDLKPENIGFDVRGDVKIFDFGLARIMPEGNNYSDLYEMSDAGSPRYMAPECLRDDEYNLKADVYSFSLIVWEMLAGETPYGFVRSREQLYRHVVEEFGRPLIDIGWPAGIRDMLESCFDADIDKRLKIKECYDLIRTFLIELRGGSNKGLTDSIINRRRSIRSERLSLEEATTLEELLLDCECE